MLTRWIHHKRAPLWMGLLGVLIRLLWVISVEVTPTSDAAWYVETASNWANSGMYEEGGISTAFFPPAYPAFLALIFSLFGTHLLIVQLFQVALSGLILFFSYQLTKRWFNPQIALWSLIILSVYPNYIAYCSLLLSELFFTSMLLGGFYFMGKENGNRLLSLLLAACLWAIAVMAKPWLIALPLLLFLGKRQTYKLSKIAIIYLIIACFAAAWGYRNHQQLGAFVPFSTNGGINLWIGNNEATTGTYHFDEKLQAKLAEATDEVAKDKLAMSMAIDYIAAHPWQSFKRIPQKLYYVFHHGNEGFFWLQMGKTNLPFPIWRSLSMAAQGFYVLILVSALLFLFSQFFLSKHAFSYRDSLIFCLLLISIYAIFFGYSRYHFPMVPFLVMYAVAFWQKRIFVKRQRK